MYDTAYHKLGESGGGGGGGTTLNRYSYSGEDMSLVQKIMTEAEVSYFDIKINGLQCVLPVSKGGQYRAANGTVTDNDSIICASITSMSNRLYIRTSILQNTNNVLSFSTYEDTMSGYTKIIYFNSTEITA